MDEKLWSCWERDGSMLARGLGQAWEAEEG
jgi:hypothetical protein